MTATTADRGRTVALVPARAGSKRIPGKNLRLLGGRSLVARAVLTAQLSPALEAVFVSTDDPAVEDEANELGAGVIHRPGELCDDTTVLDQVVVHAVEQLAGANDPFDAVCLMNPTAPFRRVDEVTAAVERLRSTGADFVCTAVEYEHHPYYALEADADGRLRPHFGADVFTKDRKQHPRLWRPIAVARVARRAAVLRYRTTFGPGMLLHPVDDTSGVDIDTPLDLAFAEYLMGTGHDPLAHHGGPK